MNNKERFDEILKNLICYAPVNSKVRYGHNLDGGYIVVSGYKYDCFLSAGIGKEVTFEEAFLENNPDTAYCVAFDGTLDRYEALPHKIKYVKRNIDTYDSESTTTLKKYIEPYKDAFLKLDIEGEEWNWARTFEDSFHKCKQLVLECHAIFPFGLPEGKGYYKGHYMKTDDTGKRSHVSQDEWLDNILKSLRIINKTHYLVHAHQNADAPFIEYNGNSYPSFYELTFIRRKDCKITGLNKENYPIDGLDFPSGRSDPAMLLPNGAHYDPNFGDKDQSFYPFVDQRSKLKEAALKIQVEINRIEKIYSDLFLC